MALLDFIANTLTNPLGVAVGAISQIATKGPSALVGVFNGQNVAPKANSSSGQTPYVAVPSNSAGLGIFNQVLNLTPIGSMITNAGKQSVAFSPAVKGGIASVPSPVVDTIKNFGIPLPSGPAQQVQAAGISAGGYTITATQQQKESDNLSILVGIAVATKLLKLW